ncbi:MAG: uracil-DNA glycosylase family protein [Acidobacteriota bacterium]
MGTAQELEAAAAALRRLAEEVIACRRCPRLREHCRQVAEQKRRAYRNWDYWGRPVPGWGDPGARLLVVGLAPAAHGANRTGRMFTGDSSGDLLYRTLWEHGFCNQATSRSRDDGLLLRDCYITAAARCAPPGNRPTREELDHCRDYLLEELRLLSRVRVVIALGAIAWNACLRILEAVGHAIPKPKPRFGHLAEVRIAGDPPRILLGSYHPSRQNTQTGRLTESMFRQVFARAKELVTGDG